MVGRDCQREQSGVTLPRTGKRDWSVFPSCATCPAQEAPPPMPVQICFVHCGHGAKRVLSSLAPHAHCQINNHPRWWVSCSSFVLCVAWVPHTSVPLATDEPGAVSSVGGHVPQCVSCCDLPRAWVLPPLRCCGSGGVGLSVLLQCPLALLHGGRLLFLEKPLYSP